MLQKYEKNSVIDCMKFYDFYQTIFYFVNIDIILILKIKLNIFFYVAL